MHKILSFLFLTLWISVTTISCNNKTIPDAPEKEETLKQTSIEDVLSSDLPIGKNPTSAASSGEEDCHGTRKVVQLIQDRKGRMIKIGNKFLISSLSGTSRYNACSIPRDFRTEDLLVTFSGEALEIFHNERLMGTPFRITTISKTKE